MQGMVRIIASIFLLQFGLAIAMADEFEDNPSYNANALLGSAAAGPGYSVASPVASDGYLRIYRLESPWGSFTVHGDQMLFMRIKELNALEAMQRTTQSEEFSRALVKAGLKPVEFAGSLLSSPIGTVKNTVSGVGQLFNSIGSGIANAGKSKESTVASVTGAAKQRRLIAYSYGIDPYTDLEPLGEKLDQLSRAAAAGGLAVTGAFMLVPGAAGTIISNTATAGTLNEAIRDRSAAQLMESSKKTLRTLGLDSEVVEEFLANPNFTPVDVASMSQALATMGKLPGYDAMLGRSAVARNRSLAYFLRRRIELTAEYQAATGELTGFTVLDGVPFPMSTTGSNGLVGVFPIDVLPWTESTSKPIIALTNAARRDGYTGPLVLVLSGSTTPLAKKKLAKLGWTVYRMDKGQ